MFLKLFKYEWKATAPILAIISITPIIVGFIAALTIRMMIKVGTVIDQTYEDVAPLVLVEMLLMFMLIFLIGALMIYMVATEILLLYRYYKNKFTDEGYLTFTLPVNSHQLFLSAFLNMLIWMIISTALIIIAVAIAVYFGVITSGVLETDLAIIFRSFEEEMAYNGYLTEFLSLSILQYAIAYIYAPVMIMTCITVGATIAKKHKILAAVGIYYVVTFVVGMLSSFFSLFSLLGDETGAVLYGPLWAQIALEVVLTVAGYLISTRCMKKKLNLP